MEELQLQRRLNIDAAQNYLHQKLVNEAQLNLSTYDVHVLSMYYQKILKIDRKLMIIRPFQIVKQRLQNEEYAASERAKLLDECNRTFKSIAAQRVDTDKGKEEKFKKRFNSYADQLDESKDLLCYFDQIIQTPMSYDTNPTEDDTSEKIFEEIVPPALVSSSHLPKKLSEAILTFGPIKDAGSIEDVHFPEVPKNNCPQRC